MVLHFCILVFLDKELVCCNALLSPVQRWLLPIRFAIHASIHKCSWQAILSRSWDILSTLSYVLLSWSSSAILHVYSTLTRLAVHCWSTYKFAIYLKEQPYILFSQTVKYSYMHFCKSIMVLQMLQIISFGYSLFWIKLDVKRVSRFYVVIIFVQVIFNANPRFHAWTKHMKWIIFCMRSSFKAILGNRFVSTKYQIANLRENCFIVRALLDKQWGREAWSLILKILHCLYYNESRCYIY